MFLTRFKDGRVLRVERVTKKKPIVPLVLYLIFFRYWMWIHHENMPRYNFDPLKPHFYIVKLGFTGVYIIFLILLKNIDCGYSLELPR